MIMRLDYQFTYNGKIYNGNGVDIGDTIDLNDEAKNEIELKISAICYEFDLTVDDEEQINKVLNEACFDWCELRD